MKFDKFGGRQTMKKMPRVVIALGIASFLTDFSSEMIYPLLPIFLTTVVGAGAFAVGLIEGVAEATAALLKIASGLWTDKVRRRKPFVLVGYGIAGLVRPLIGIATNWPTVMALRFTDRIGKGIRTSPRDALIADSVESSYRATAYGFHRSMDHAGAMVGPLVAALLLSVAGLTLRSVFLLAAIPAVLVMVVLWLGVHDSPSDGEKSRPRRASLVSHWSLLPRDFKAVLLALLVFTLGNSTDAFILLRLSESGVPAAGVALLWALHHAVKMLATFYGGILGDRLGRRPMIVAGWTFYAGIYCALAFIDVHWGVIAIFLLYGIYYGLVEPSEKAWVADMAPTNLRGTALGYYHGVVGLAALPSSLLFGAIWSAYGYPAAFCTGAVLALAASILLVAFTQNHPRTEVR